MKNVIYQYWDGNVRESCLAGSRNMKAYADRIGADYLFEDNPKFLKSRFGLDFGSYSPHYGAFKPVYDESFAEYDNVLFVDTDVFTVDGLTENIFENFDAEIGICTEPSQPKRRQITLGKITTEADERWASVVEKEYNIQVPRTDEGLMKVYNTGMVLYSKEGLQKARERFVPFQDYVNLIRPHGLPSFYNCDQPYLHAMMLACDFNWVEMDNNWNSYVFTTRDKEHDGRYNVDERTPDTKFVHVQLRGADDWGEREHWNVVNLPRSQWGVE